MRVLCWKIVRRIQEQTNNNRITQHIDNSNHPPWSKILSRHNSISIYKVVTLFRKQDAEEEQEQELLTCRWQHHIQKCFHKSHVDRGDGQASSLYRELLCRDATCINTCTQEHSTIYYYFAQVSKLHTVVHYTPAIASGMEVARFLQ